jgi:cell division protein FtsL
VVEFYTVKRIDNSRLVRRRQGGLVRTCGRQLMIAGVVAAALLAYTWQRYECLQYSYQYEQVKQTESQAAELNRELRVELATLRSPARIDLLARDKLGMTVPQPAQIILTQSRAAGEIADAGSTTNPSSFR